MLLFANQKAKNASAAKTIKNLASLACKTNLPLFTKERNSAKHKAIQIKKAANPINSTKIKFLGRMFSPHSTHGKTAPKTAA